MKRVYEFLAAPQRKSLTRATSEAENRKQILVPASSDGRCWFLKCCRLLAHQIFTDLRLVSPRKLLCTPRARHSRLQFHVQVFKHTPRGKHTPAARVRVGKDVDAWRVVAGRPSSSEYKGETSFLKK